LLFLGHNLPTTNATLLQGQPRALGYRFLPLKEENKQIAI